MRNSRVVQLSFVICVATLALSGCGSALTAPPERNATSSASQEKVQDGRKGRRWLAAACGLCRFVRKIPRVFSRKKAPPVVSGSL
jgi:uncharacterized protein YceK